MKTEIEALRELAKTVDRFLSPHRLDCHKFGFQARQFSEDLTNEEKENLCSCGMNKIKAQKDMENALYTYFRSEE